VFGLGTHLDPVRSTRRHRIFAFGHVWVVLAVLVRLPMTSRPWALPILFRLYRNERECTKRGDPYRKKTALARAMLDELLSWTELPVRVVADVAYCNRHAPARSRRAGRLRRHDAPRRRPHRAPDRGRAEEDRPPSREGLRPAETGGARFEHAKPVAARPRNALWEGARRPHQDDARAVAHRVRRGTPPRRPVRLDHGRIPFRTFFSSDPDLDAVDILETYAGRWSIEVAFRNLKQHLGFADSPARLRRAVERAASFVGLLYTCLVLWLLEHAADQPLALVPVRTWYRHKATLSFEDVLRAARTDLLLPVSDPSVLPTT
jgi:hypothetical protein